jgi:hypothetical protein
MIFLFWILCGVFSAMIAGGKGHGGCSWLLGGFLFGPIALIATIGLRDRKRDWDTQRLINTQEEMLDEIQRKHAWERRQWEMEKRRQYLESREEQTERYLRPVAEEEFYEDLVDESIDTEVSDEEEDDLDYYLHTLEYAEEVPSLKEQLNILGINTKEDFLARLKWSHEQGEGNPEEEFAKHIWKEILNKTQETDYLKYWKEELSNSFASAETPDNIYFFEKRL